MTSLSRLCAILALVIVMCAGQLPALTRRVPQDYVSIQMALNSLQDNDTILVTLGNYAEQLVAPPRSGWTMRGDVVPDTGDYPRPMVDPSSLPRPDTVNCLRLDTLSHDITLEDLVFRNGLPMYGVIPRPWGGILNPSTNLTIKRCVFDSTYVGVSGGTGLTLESCRFVLNRVFCTYTIAGPIHAVNCLFSCNRGGGYNVYAVSGSTFSFCQFRDNMGGMLFRSYGDNILIEDCVFGPFGPSVVFDAVGMYVRTGCVVRRNVFANCQTWTVLDIAMDCAVAQSLPIVVSENTFVNYRSVEGTGGTAIGTTCQSQETPTTNYGVFENNIFEDGSSTSTSISNGLYLDSRATVRGNRFTRLEPATVPNVAVYSWEAGMVDTVILRNNLFDSAAFAVSAPTNGAAHAWIDARWNWWGDSSGPYNADFNPNGHGGEIEGYVDFDPWYRDTSFLADAHERRTPLPAQFGLAAYPNPFNSVVRFRLFAPAGMIVRLELFDLLGRKVKDVWQGAMIYEKEIPFEGAGLASGVYFAGAGDVLMNRILATQKIVLLK